MRKPLLKIYKALPGPLRSAAATARGLYLRSWRYGSETPQLVEAALARDTWTQAQWDAWQKDHLSALLHRAATRVPYYREAWQRRRDAGDTSSWTVLENWPVLTKDALRANPRAFVADDRDPRRLLAANTSGTSGKPLTIWIDRADDRRWYSLFEARWRRWYDVSRHDRWAIIGGQPVVPVTQEEPPFWVWNAALHQLYMTPYHISLANAPHYFAALRDYRIEYIYGYASALYLLAQFALEGGYDVPAMKVAIADAEPLWPYQRPIIEEAFGCPVRESYGMAEKVMAASECEAGSLHVWPDAGKLEVLHDETDDPVRLGEAGRLICTGLINTSMPLIRYQVGDRGSLSADSSRCDCGRTLPVLASVEGRLDDVILMPDGRRLGRLSPAFKGDIAIQEAQVIQETRHRIRVLVVPTSEYSERDERTIVRNLRDRLGNMEIVVEPVDSIPRTSSGKFRGIVNKLLASPTESTPQDDPVP